MKALQAVMAVMVMGLTIGPAFADGVVVSGKHTHMGHEARVGYSWKLGGKCYDPVEVSDRAAKSEVHEITRFAVTPRDEKPPVFKRLSTWLWIGLGTVAIVMWGENNDWSFSSDSSDKSSSEADNRSFSLSIADGAKVGDDINISNLTINNFAIPESEEEESSSEE